MVNSRPKGMTLIELLLAVALGSLIVSGVGKLSVLSLDAYKANQLRSENLQQAIFASERIAMLIKSSPSLAQWDAQQGALSFTLPTEYCTYKYNSTTSYKVSYYLVSASGRLVEKIDSDNQEHTLATGVSNFSVTLPYTLDENGQRVKMTLTLGSGASELVYTQVLRGTGV